MPLIGRARSGVVRPDQGQKVYRLGRRGGNPPGLFGQPQRKLESIRQISVMLPLSSISASTAISAMTF
jgi:hypothetical protein